MVSRNMVVYNEQEIHRRIFDLVSLSIKEVIPLMEWSLEGVGRVELPYASRSTPDKLYVFETSVKLREVENTEWILKFSLSGNGLLKINGKVHQGIDPYHSFTFVKSGEHSVRLEVTPRSLFGENPWSITFNYALAAAANWKGISLGIGMLEALKLARNAQDSLKTELLQALSKALSLIDIVPTIRQVTAAHALFENLESRWDRGYITSVYGIPVLLGIYRDVEDPAILEAEVRIEEAYKVFIEDLKNLADKYGKTGEVIVFGHAHIDAAWLWPYSETLRKIPRTFANVLALFEHGYDLSFAQSSAQYYKWLEEQDKSLFEAVARRVNEKRWIPVGGMWVEPDTNLVSGESLARQLLYGQLYFKEKFSRIARIGWLP
ncbi:MAG: hypothetical protein OWQ48_03790, partial [Desulfurococcus sp.]|nr:hypothetical protein [Desulfurococcus sp.]